MNIFLPDLVAVVEENGQINIGLIEKTLQTLPEKLLGLGIRIILALLVFWIGSRIINGIRHVVIKSMEKSNADIGVRQFLGSFIKVALTIILIFMIASWFGMDAASIIAVLGSAGVAIGLALQGSLSNFAGGVLILLLKPFKVGDYIVENTGKNEGVVKEITLFYTKLATYDNRIVILPNGALANSSMTNLTDMPNRRIDIGVGISYSSSIETAKKVIQTIMAQCPYTLQGEDNQVFVEKLDESSILMGVRCWVKTEDYWKGKFYLNEHIKLALDQAGVTIPFPQVDVHLVDNFAKKENNDD